MVIQVYYSNVLRTACRQVNQTPVKAITLYIQHTELKCLFKELVVFSKACLHTYAVTMESNSATYDTSYVTVHSFVTSLLIYIELQSILLSRD